MKVIADNAEQKKSTETLIVAAAWVVAVVILCAFPALALLGY